MRAREIIKKLKDAGFQEKSQKGSHVKFEKDGKIVIVPNHGSKDIPNGTVRAIEKQSGVKIL